MDSNTRVITEIKVKLENIEKQINELKGVVKSDYQTKEGSLTIKDCMGDLEERIVKIEANLSKVVWIVLSAVISAILYLVIKT